MLQTQLLERGEREALREREYYTFEEATDIAERLGYPVSHDMTHHIREGKVYDDLGIRIADYTQRSLDVAPSQFYGDSAFEVERRRIEHQKTLLAEDLAAGKLAGNAMIEYSPAPAAVLEGRSSIDGYRPDLRRDFARIYYMDGDKLHCRIFSLDNVSATTRQAVGEFLGIDMTPGVSDEVILSDSTVCTLTSDQVDDLTAMTKLIHDDTLAREKGGRWHAGSRFEDQRGALQLVLSHRDLLEEHMNAWSEVMKTALDKTSANKRFENQRKRTTAAIFARLQGDDVGSSSDGVVDATMSSHSFDAGCATGTIASDNTLEGMAMSRGRRREAFKPGECRVCLQKKAVGECNVCQGCEDADNRGQDLSAIYARAMKRQKQEASRQAEFQTKSESAPRRIGKQALIRQKYGTNARFRMEKTVGDEITVVLDGRGQEIDRF